MIYSGKIYRILIVFSIFLFACESKEELKNSAKNLKDSEINTPQNKDLALTSFETDSIAKLVLYKAGRYPLNSEKRRNILDSAITKHPKIAYLYQQRVMPLYKEDKDELGLPFLEKAAALDPEKWLDYMAFMKCIFSKNYKDAIVDFNKALELNGESYVMDHSYYFYLGLCNLQLNAFEKAKDFFEKSIAQSVKEDGEEWIHFTDLMYLGIANYELNNFEEAIKIFDEALLLQPKFSDVKYYKAICLGRIGEIEKAEKTFIEAKEDFINDDIMYEDNTIYERYPYQVRKSWFGL
ncbi:tetratricopeptide repeat protein [Lacinutrix himadriensis]|uniref:tetratricopeptide repeat protein n=1 Tax=Lacinutrix himadriensis TaxID=641549 RepID=UPI000B2F95DB|nr:tetratricopeptide repeat protein [Lacinutrix himadriensis]